MLLAELARDQGVFDWVSSVAVRGANGSCSRLFFLVYAVGTIVTIFMSNDATAMVLTPAILAVIRKSKDLSRFPTSLSAHSSPTPRASCFPSPTPQISSSSTPECLR